MAEANVPIISSAQRPRPLAHTDPWTALRLYSVYRVVLAGLFVVLFYSANLPVPLGRSHPSLFYLTSILYLMAGLVAAFTAQFKRPPFALQVYGQVCLDIVAITLLMHASGGISSGIGMLLVVCIASAALLTAGRTAGLFAAVASLAILLEQFLGQLSGGMDNYDYPRAGLLGGTLFATAILSHALARRARESEALAAQRGVDLANMAQLTEFVIQHMQTGVLVVDGDHSVRLMNGAAWNLLGQPEDREQRTLDTLCPALARRLAAWRRQQDNEAETLQVAGSSAELLPHFTTIGKDRTAGYLIFLEDASASARQAQQLKLAALGRLTASIAHEIRNPLGAISHAGELLGESPQLDPPDRRLTEIIRDHSQRINTIIESVLQLGRRDRSKPEFIALQTWLAQFCEGFCLSYGIPTESIVVEVEPAQLTVWFDPNHLHQILANLCRNGLSHSPEPAPQPALYLQAGIEADGNAYLDVTDSGPGVPDEAIAKIFEPFFTTASSGTGLGLYICRELAQCNHGRLIYHPTVQGQSRFRLSFPQREENS